LLSGNSQVDQNFRVGHNEIMLPSVGATEVRCDAFSGMRVGSLASKIAIINKNLAFAWSGDLERASRLLSHIQQTVPSTIRDIECINSCLSSATYDDIDQTKLIALFKTRDDKICLQQKDADIEFHSELIGKGFAAGSGSSHLQRELKCFSPENLGYFSEKPVHAGLMALGKAMIAAGHLLTRQIAVNAFIDQYFGGLFELAYAGQDSIQKLDDLSFFFWTVDDDWQFLSQVNLTINLSYVDDVLIVKRAEGFRTDGLPISLDRRNAGFKAFFLPPIHKAVDMKTIIGRLTSDLNSTHQCHCIICKNHGQFLGIYAPFINGRQEAIKFEWDHGRLLFSIKRSFQERLMELVACTSETMKSRL